MAKKVFIGVGHGGPDPGAVANGFKEADLNLAISLACRDELVRHGVQVRMSRTKDEEDRLADVIRECNAFGPDLALDIHNNAGGGDGGEVFHHHGGGTSKKLAQNIVKELAKIGQNLREGDSGEKDGLITKLNSAGRDYFGFIRQTVAPAVLVECAFVDNKTDIKIIDTPAEQKVMGEAIARGVLTTLGIAYKAKEDKVSNTTKKDNTPDSYAKSAIDKAVKKGVLKGTDTGDYMLHSGITRQDFFVFLDRLGLLD